MPSSTPTSTLLAGLGQLLELLGHEFAAPSWSNWKILLRAVFDGVETLTDDERAFVESVTGRSVLPTPDTLRELWFIIGRRAGKSRISALLAVWAATCRAYALAAGEVPVVMLTAADRAQARISKRYISGLLHAHPMLEAMVRSETAESIRLRNGVAIEIHTASFRTVRGYTIVAFLGDEVAFWSADDFGQNPDHEILTAVRAAMITVPNALIVMSTSPHARRGESFKMFEKHFANNGSSRVLVARASTLTMNPLVPADIIASAFEDDPSAAASEYDAQWRSDLESYVDRPTLLDCVEDGTHERPPRADTRYTAFIDPAGGSGSDSMALCVGHTEVENGVVFAVLDCLREARPKFSPDTVTTEFAAVLRSYSISRVQGDRFAGEWVREPFRRLGITYDLADKTKSQFYADALPLINSGRVELLDHDRLTGQIAMLERRTGPSGRTLIDHPRGANDDLANVGLAVAVLLAADTANAVRGLVW